MAAEDQRFERMEKSIDKLGEKVDDLTKVVTAMARIEERMITLFKRMDLYEADRAKLSTRIETIEKVTLQRGVVYQALDKGIWLLLGAAVTYGIKLLGKTG